MKPSSSEFRFMRRGRQSIRLTLIMIALISVLIVPFAWRYRLDRNKRIRDQVLRVEADGIRQRLVAYDERLYATRSHIQQWAKWSGRVDPGNRKVRPEELDAQLRLIEDQFAQASSDLEEMRSQLHMMRNEKDLLETKLQEIEWKLRGSK